MSFASKIGVRHQNERLTLVSTFLIAYCRYLKCRIRGPATCFVMAMQCMHYLF